MLDADGVLKVGTGGVNVGASDSTITFNGGKLAISGSVRTTGAGNLYLNGNDGDVIVVNENTGAWIRMFECAGDATGRVRVAGGRDFVLYTSRSCGVAKKDANKDASLCLQHTGLTKLNKGQVHRNLVVDGDFNLENRFGFTYADEFEGEWEMVEDGVSMHREPFRVPHIAPLSKGSLGLPKFEAAAGKECFVNVYFCLKADTEWAKRGWVVSRNQIALSPSARQTAEVDAVKPKFTEDDKTVTAVAGGTRAVFCRRTGTLCELVMNGRTILKDPAPGIAAGPRLTCLRAFTDNDVWLRGYQLEEAGSIYLTGLTQLSYHARPVVIDGDAPDLNKGDPTGIGMAELAVFDAEGHRLNVTGTATMGALTEENFGGDYNGRMYDESDSSCYLGNAVPTIAEESTWKYTSFSLSPSAPAVASYNLKSGSNGPSNSRPKTWRVYARARTQRTNGS